MKFLFEIEYPDGRRQENEWTMEELLRPNGEEPFIAWFLRELNGLGVEKIRIETIESAIHPDYFERTGP